MTTISVSNIQDNVSDAITGISGAGFRRSTFPILMFGKTQQTVAHLAFAVGSNTLVIKIIILNKFKFVKVGH